MEVGLAQPEHIQSNKGYASLTKHENHWNRKMLNAIRKAIESKLVGDRYGRLTVQVEIEHGFIQQQIVVTFAEKIRVTR